MALIHRPARAYRPLAFGAVGGLVAAIPALVTLWSSSIYKGHEPSVALNAVGAWLVRWLQTADPSALDGYYWDATLGGAVVFVVVAAAVGSVFAGFLDRLPEDHPVAWGALLGLVLWALTIWAVGPAIDPVLTRTLSHGVLLLTDLVFGVVLGAWIHSGRAVRQGMHHA